MALTADYRDIFISYAGEDREQVAKPLADQLIGRGLSVWVADYELTAGDSLRQRIDEGLSRARLGVVVLSTSFFGKGWPEWELMGLIRRRQTGEFVVVPIWHRLSADDVAAHSPSLADIVALDSKDGVDALADGVEASLAKVERSAGPSQPPRALASPTTSRPSRRRRREGVLLPRWLRWLVVRLRRVEAWARNHPLMAGIVASLVASAIIAALGFLIDPVRRGLDSMAALDWTLGFGIGLTFAAALLLAHQLRMGMSATTAAARIAAFVISATAVLALVRAGSWKAEEPLDTPSASYLTAVNASLTELHRSRKAAGEELETASTSAEQAKAARRLAQAFSNARNALGGVHVSPVELGEDRRLRAALEEVEDSYLEMARAAQNDEPVAFGAAAKQVRRALKRLQSVRDQLASKAQPN